MDQLFMYRRLRQVRQQPRRDPRFACGKRLVQLILVLVGAVADQCRTAV
jgi:hypothetical protein